MGSLTISLGGLSLTIDKFVGDRQIRQRLAPVTLDRTAYGTLVVPGTSYELPHQWQGKAILNPAQFETWRLIWALADYNQRTSGTGYRLTIDDTTRPFEEVGNQSREKVLGTNVTMSDGLTIYFARFRGVFATSEPEYTDHGNQVEVDFTIWEDGIFAFVA
ncbi:hypothetical protein Pse7367_3651 (plasmid) [Thalassoporum mexicanum PCC 7367]|uniref:hypothetical protein n=1 Tax=Thalassoporum mexicanum TaxID=3457544 RepID=UPI00029FE3F3|nr:hypothetical protein [Pseudanabaena sp. PCC 7367]AFY71884.1 hypothetical protein Pse7367_3651 [Pseudanabaena sp. PCC 7367]